MDFYSFGPSRLAPLFIITLAALHSQGGAADHPAPFWQSPCSGACCFGPELLGHDHSIPDAIDTDKNTPAGPRLILATEPGLITLHENGRVVSLESPQLFDRLNNRPTLDEFATITKALYDVFGDEFDFVFLISNQFNIPPTVPYAGIYLEAFNDTPGIGRPPVDFRPIYGASSSSPLQGVIHLPARDYIRFGPSLHELLHRFANYIAAVPTGVTAHWGNSNVGGQLGGWKPGTLVDLGEGRYQVTNPRTNQPGRTGSFANGGNGLPYSNLELYLMGLIPASEIGHDIEVARDLVWEDDNAGIFRASRIDVYPLSEVLAGLGPRLPGNTQPQTEFRLLYVVVTPAPMEENLWSFQDQLIEDFTRPAANSSASNFNFWEATGGRATLRADGLHDLILNYPGPLDALLGLLPGQAVMDLNSDEHVDAADMVP
jgi:hypothetical protein